MSSQEEFLTYHILKSKFQNGDITDSLYDYSFDSQSGNIKNVCAKMHINLVNRIESAIELLGVNKRLFIETAVIAFLDELEHLAVKHEHPSLVDSKGGKS